MDNDPDTPQKVVIVAVVHHISWATARAKTHWRPHGHGGRSSSSSSTPHLTGNDPGRPVKHMGRLMGRAVRPIQSPHLMGRGPARPIKFRDDGPSNFERVGRGPTQPTHFRILTARPGRAHHFSKVSARPGPARHNFQIGPARPGSVTWPVTSPDNIHVSFVYNFYSLLSSTPVLESICTAVLLMQTLLIGTCRNYLHAVRGVG